MGRGGLAHGGDPGPAGPDDDGVWQTRQCALAHRRLAVIDPAHGAQPMVRTLEGGQCAICYNGELYNTPELRRELEALGVALETWSDTEVLLWQCILFGEAALEKTGGHLCLRLLGWAQPEAAAGPGPVRGEAPVLCPPGQRTGLWQ